MSEGVFGGRHLAVIGLGESGLAMARWLDRHGARVSVLDSRDSPPSATALASDCPGARFVPGPLTLGRFDADDLPEALYWSPGLSPHIGAAAALFGEAMAAGIAVRGELDLFADELERRAADGYRPKVIAITGTNGKTTVTQLVAHLCREAGLDTEAAGNISPSLIDALAARERAGRLPAVWVLELSSFQLAIAAPLASDAAAILNLSQNHLDWHPTMADYLESKRRILERTACQVVNLDDAASDPLVPVAAATGAGAGVSTAGATTGAFAGTAKGPKAEKTVKPARSARSDRSGASARAARRIGFALAPPTTTPGFGLVRDGGLAWLAEASVDPTDISGRRRALASDALVSRLMPADALRIRGAHNHANALAALALCRAINVPTAAMLHGLRDFETADHRCALVAIHNDVQYVDDSKGTNVGATVAALNGLGKRCILIAGGLGKGQDFTPLAAPVRRHARAVMLIGRAAGELRAALAATGSELLDCATLDEAVVQAAARARSGEVVLLSPACASQDMFRNYSHRAEVFIAAVKRLCTEAGQPC
ncbi:MAG: UDP-N-acetylmuramoyl-L-alanine--D-glutamate ligase [Burkholderiaceae bacterium]